VTDVFQSIGPNKGVIGLVFTKMLFQLWTSENEHTSALSKINTSQLLVLLAAFSVFSSVSPDSFGSRDHISGGAASVFPL
jgi:hypothetical protein